MLYQLVRFIICFAIETSSFATFLAGASLAAGRTRQTGAAGAHQPGNHADAHRDKKVRKR